MYPMRIAGSVGGIGDTERIEICDAAGNSRVSECSNLAPGLSCDDYEMSLPLGKQTRLDPILVTFYGILRIARRHML